MLYGSRRQIEGQYIFCNMISNELPLYYLITHHQLFSELIVIMCSSSLPYKFCQIICFHCNEKKRRFIRKFEWTKSFNNRLSLWLRPELLHNFTKDRYDPDTREYHTKSDHTSVLIVILWFRFLQYVAPNRLDTNRDWNVFNLSLSGWIIFVPYMIITTHNMHYTFNLIITVIRYMDKSVIGNENSTQSPRHHEDSSVCASENLLS